MDLSSFLPALSLFTLGVVFALVVVQLVTFLRRRRRGELGSRPFPGRDRNATGGGRDRGSR